MAAGCGCFGAAFEERIERPLTGERVTLALACDAAPAARPAALPVSALVDGSGQGDRVGTMHDQVSLDGIPLFLAGGSAVARLAADVEAILAGAASPGNAARLALWLEGAWVESQVAPWYALRGPIRARVAFRVQLLDPASGAMRWERRFEKETERRVVYFLAADHAAALSDAWCAALAELAQAAAGEDFRAALGGW